MQEKTGDEIKQTMVEIYEQIQLGNEQQKRSF